MNEIITRTYVGSPAEIQSSIKSFLEENPDYEVAGRTQQQSGDTPGTDIAYITYMKKEEING